MGTKPAESGAMVGMGGNGASPGRTRSFSNLPLSSPVLEQSFVNVIWTYFNEKDKLSINSTRDRKKE